MKYTRLTKEQFEIFHQQFSEFLATQKIDTDEWKKIVETNPKLTEDQLDLFSDIVWDDALNNAEYLEHISAKDLKAFKFNEKTIEVLSVKINEDLDIDLTKEESIKLLFENIMDSRIDLFQGNKNIDTIRNEEMFQLVTEGCIITDGRMFKALKEIIN
ncbi:MAG: hypothetical protein KAG96_05530 [Ichthyobacteriaceae bacterium]|nr:hypothetical protein [Ichthyobacteriaceae bacterium]